MPVRANHWHVGPSHRLPSFKSHMGSKLVETRRLRSLHQLMWHRKVSLIKYLGGSTKLAIQGSVRPNTRNASASAAEMPATATANIIVSNAA